MDEARGVCYADSCGKSIPGNMLMCWNHWRRVPRAIQRSVWQSNYLAHPAHESSRLAARVSIALKEGLPWAALSAEERDTAIFYRMGEDGSPKKDGPR